MTDIPAGMVAWAGGDSAPEDWDGGWVLLADGEHWGPFNDPTGGWATWNMPDYSPRRIIAYTPRQPTATADAEGRAREVHPDDIAVDRFAEQMKAKLAAARANGRSGWDDPNQCNPNILRRMLHEHVVKGDPVDVANFCMMLAHYGASICYDEGDEFAGVEAYEHEDQCELSRLYNHRFDDSPQFNRGQMRTAIKHGRRLASVIPDGIEKAVTTLDVFLAAYANRPDIALARPHPRDDLLTWGHLRAILRTLTAMRQYAAEEVARERVDVRRQCEEAMEQGYFAGVADERERCAKVCDAYTEVNFEQAGDSVLLDPCLSGKGFTPENIAESERQQINGLVHSSQAHAGKHLAAAIRAGGSE